MSLTYQPRHFKHDDRAAALAVMRAHPFATLLSVHDGEPRLTHAPLVAQQEGESLRLLGHVAKANAHWQAWDAAGAGAQVTAIFHGPDAFVSPFWYQNVENVPTWNYIVVHAHGRVTLSHNSAVKERMLKALIDAHDPPYRARWDEQLSEDYRERHKSHIVGFEIQIERIDAKFKLSQNRAPADRAGVLAAMDQGGAPQQELAQWMRALGPT
jgi:transcriptional regulator